MSITRIATANVFSSVLADLMKAQNRQIDAQKAVSTGKIGDDLKGFSDRARSVVAAQSVKARVDGLVDQLDGVSVKLQAQQLALESVSGAADGLRQAVTSALASGRADGLMNEVQSYFSQTAEALNTRYGDGYLFSGGQVNTPPVNVSSLTALAALPDAADAFDNGGLAPVSRIDDSSTLQTGFVADAVGKPLMAALRAIQLFNQSSDGPLGATLTDAQTTFLQGQLATLNTVSQDTVAVAAQGGGIQQQVEHAQSVQKARQVSLETMLGDLTNVDVAEAATQLSQSQLAVQASAQVFMSLKDMSLLNFLK